MQKKQDRNANVIAGFLVIGVAAAALAAKLTNLGGGLVLGGLVAAVFVSLWYLFLISMTMIGTFRIVYRQKQKKEKKYKTVLFTAVMAVILFVMLWQYQNTMQGQRRDTGIWSGAQQYAESLLKLEKGLENDWLIGDESWREGKNIYHIRLTYYANEADAGQGYESTYEYVISFDEMEGFTVKSEGIPEKELELPQAN